MDGDSPERISSLTSTSSGKMVRLFSQSGRLNRGGTTLGSAPWKNLSTGFFPETIYKLTATYLENVDRGNRCQFAQVLMERNFALISMSASPSP